MPFPVKYIPLMIALFLLGAVSAMSYIASQNSTLTAEQASSAKLKALIGGPFEMVDHHNQKVTDKTYLGQYILVYFGFTYCPDICPTELQMLTEALNMLPKEQSDKIKVLLVSIDPERDNPTQLGLYVSNFHKNVIGLSGTPKQTKDMANVYRAYYKRVEDKDNPDGYTMDHSSIVYLMGPDGKYISHFSYGTRSKVISDKISAIMAGS